MLSLHRNGPTLVTGGSGQLATAFAAIESDMIVLSRSELDITNVDEIRALIGELKPSVIVNCAAYTAVDDAESDEESATNVNGTAVGNLAEIAAENQCRFVTYSSDYVFDGTATVPYLEGDPTMPINAYGRSKLIGEELALGASDDSLVIRTSWVLSGTHENFVSTMLRLTASGNSLTVVDDQVGSPTVVEDLVRATAGLLECNATGIFHVTNQGSTTWFELARFAVSRGGMNPDLIQPCSTAEYPTPARRPAYSVLGTERLDKTGVVFPRPWRDAVRSIVDVQVRRIA
jgi:dTDP-4-dehydrorhamnose reductase